MSEIFNLDALFTYADAAPLTVEEEVAAIEAAQLGDEAATLRLMEAYGPTLRASVSRISGLVEGDAPIDVEDARMAAVSGFLEALHSHDVTRGDGRLASIVAGYIMDALKEATKDTRPALTIPARTLSRFFGILREADGDVERARELAPSREMTHATFDQILAAARPGSIDALRDPNSDGEIRDLIAEPVYTSTPVVDAEDSILVDAALHACDDTEHSIVRLKYGFTPVVEVIDGVRVPVDRLPTDEEIGSIIGKSRPAVQRHGKAALRKMREALGVTVASSKEA